ncbi:hypothetical protein AGMMS49957_15120 [Synergistales bacterium]|nr:hypothetical protein AGMMS49957_15120 [Synergistales bacterium]
MAKISEYHKEKTQMKKSILIAVFLVFGMFSVCCAADKTDLFPAFSSKTISDENIDDGVFASAKITMVNIWATWCPPCVAEMPDLGKLGRSMPEGSQLVGLLIDAAPNDTKVISKASSILKKSKADFTQILLTKDLGPYLTKNVTAIPTTVFVNSNGEIVGKPLVGSRSGKAYRAEVEKLLSGK